MNVRVRTIDELVGNSPMYDFNNGIYAKLEFFNPSGSMKDRMVSHMLTVSEKQGEIKKGDVISEATSGNTGIALSMISASRGYKAKIFMPEYMSEERKKIIRAYGAELVLTKSMEEAEKLAEEEKDNNAFFLDQFNRKENADAHYLTTGRELIEQMQGNKIDAFIAGIGTGGTIMGVARKLREKGETEIIGILPKDEKNEIEGIGCYYQSIVQEDEISEIIRVSNKDAKNAQEKLIKEHGIFAGVSSGANYFVAQALKEKGYENVATIFADSADRYISKRE